MRMYVLFCHVFMVFEIIRAICKIENWKCMYYKTDKYKDAGLLCVHALGHHFRVHIKCMYTTYECKPFSEYASVYAWFILCMCMHTHVGTTQTNASFSLRE